MEKNILQRKLKERYALNKSFDENIVKTEESDLYRMVINHYSSWALALEDCKITELRLREREKFIIYCMMKRRYIRDGERVLRGKNIELAFKNRIFKYYHSIAALKQTVVNWTKEKVLFELRIHLLTGGSLDYINRSHSELGKHLHNHYINIEKALKDYHLKLGVELKEDKFIQVNLYELVNLGFLSHEQVHMYKELKSVERKQVIEFLKNLAVEWHSKDILEEELKENDPIMYGAVIRYFGSLKVGMVYVLDGMKQELFA